MAATQTTKKTKNTGKPTAAQRKQLQRESERVSAELARVEQELGPSQSMWARIRRIEADSMRTRLRLQYQPWVVAGGVVSLALIGQIAALAAGPTATAAGTGALIAAGAALVRRPGQGRPLRQTQLKHQPTTKETPVSEATEVINLNSAAAFAAHLKQAYSADLDRLEAITAWLAEHAPGSGLHQSFSAAQGCTADIADQAAELSAHFADQLAVRDAVEAAGANALDKDALTPGR